MDYSHLHTYAPPQCLPENTGYTYSLSSSYSTAALDFETLHEIDPVFDSPRMSRRSLRLMTTTGSYSDNLLNESVETNASYSGITPSKDRSFSKSTRQHNTSRNSTGSSLYPMRKSLSNSFIGQTSFNSHASDASMVSSVLDESLIRERTEVDHLWGLDDEELKAGDTTVIQANGDVNTAETQTTLINGYTCSDCSILSDRNDVLTAFSAPRCASTNMQGTSANTHSSSAHMHTTSGNLHSSSSNMHTTSTNMHTTTSKVYSRDRNQKQKSREMAFYGHKTVQLVKNAATSVVALVTQLFHMVMLKLGCKLKGDDCKGTKHLETQTTVHMQSSLAKRVTGTLWHIFSYTGYFLLQAVRNIGAAGWFVSRKMLSFLWLAIVSPGKAASGTFWWLGTGWYQLTTLISLLNVFFLTRCLPRILKLIFLLFPLLLLLGLWFWGSEGLLALLPALSGTSLYTSETSKEPIPTITPESDIVVSDHGKKEVGLQFDIGRISEIEKQLAIMAANHSRQVEEYSKIKSLIIKIQEQIEQLSDKSQMSTVVTNIINEHFSGRQLDKQEFSTGDTSINKEHESRILYLETLFTQLSQALEENRKQSRTSGVEIQDHDLLLRIQNLEKQIGEHKAMFLKEQTEKMNCEHADCVLQKVDAKVRESVQMMFANKDNLPESLLQWLSTHYMSKGDFTASLQELELRILKNITNHISVTKQKPTAKVIQKAVSGGIQGISEEEAHIIVNNALKLYSQDRTGMVDFALESGGGSILGTRCSETYETKTALMSLFGIPLWYFSQSPRVVIQPDMYPGNCWAFKGAQGYLVVRLSMMIHPTAFSLEHIPKSLSPTGNITSAPKDFAVYGLEDEYQENGTLLVQSLYEEEGEPLQTFQVMEENEKAFQIVELRIFSNWGHTDYTCLYRFRAHGTPVK
ncbi:SUN domain-containing protein 1 isoform 2-T2 [Discoglossus pictus]